MPSRYKPKTPVLKEAIITCEYRVKNIAIHNCCQSLVFLCINFQNAFNNYFIWNYRSYLEIILNAHLSEGIWMYIPHWLHPFCIQNLRSHIWQTLNNWNFTFLSESVCEIMQGCRHIGRLKHEQIITLHLKKT